MFKRTLGSLCLAGAILASGVSVHAAAKSVTFSNSGYSLTVPTTWKHVAKLPMNQMFHASSLWRVAPTAAIFLTADYSGGVAAIVVNSTTKANGIKSLESAMLRDGTTLLHPAAYQMITQGSVAFVIATAQSRTKGKTSSQSIAAASHGGKTYYFLSTWLVGANAKAKANLNEISGVFGSIVVH